MTNSRGLVTIVGIAAAVAMVGCGSGGTAAGSSTTASAASTSTASAEPSAEPTTAAAATTPPSSPAASPPFGTIQDSGTGGTAAVLGYAQPVAQESPQPVDAGYPADYVWAGLDVSVCVPSEIDPQYPEGYYVTRTPWSLVYADGALVQSSNTGYNGFPQPEYPWGDTTVRLGQCVRGWIVFAVPGAQTPAEVQYTGGNAGNLYWLVG